MPDTRTHRGAHPEDAALFAPGCATWANVAREIITARVPTANVVDLRESPAT